MDRIKIMPVNKNALLRYRIMDSCLTNPMRRYPTMEFILEKIEGQLGEPVSDSQFSKDIQQMKRIYKAPIKFHRTHRGYYYTEPDFSIKEFPLTHEEIEALDYSTALLHQLKGTKMFQQFENAINKVIEGYRVSKFLGKSELQILQVEEPVKAGGSEWLEKILKAIVEKSVIKIAYKGYGKEEKVHGLSPYLLKEYRNRWYVIGYSDRIEKVLVFALDRINQFELSEDMFISQPDFSPEKFFKYSFGITQLHEAKPEKVILSFTPAQSAYILSQPLHVSQKVLRQTDQLIEIELDVYITTELLMAILSYGPEVQVLKPKSLKMDIENKIREMAALYNDNPVTTE